MSDSAKMKKAYDVHLNGNEWPVDVRGLDLKIRTDTSYMYVYDADNLLFFAPIASLSHVVASSED